VYTKKALYISVFFIGQFGVGSVFALGTFGDGSVFALFGPDD